MMICCCTMSGTRACENCPRYKEYFGEQKQVFTFGKEISSKELKGRHPDIVRLNDLDDMLSAIVLRNKIADMRGEE